jgi:hypothetical protein
VLSLSYKELQPNKDGGDNMPQVYIKKELYDAIVAKKEEPNRFANDAIAGKLKKEGKSGG